MEPKRKKGPPPKYDEAMQVVSVRLPKDLVDFARAIGAGQYSAGIRLALENHKLFKR